jgi:hypothetical protein
MNIQAISSAGGFASTTGTQTTSSSGSSSGSSSSSSSSSASSSYSYDVRDLNQDGYVSAQEELIYELTHPNESSSSNLATEYTSAGSPTSSVTGTSKYVSIYA